MYVAVPCLVKLFFLIRSLPRALIVSIMISFLFSEHWYLSPVPQTVLSDFYTYLSLSLSPLILFYPPHSLNLNPGILHISFHFCCLSLWNHYSSSEWNSHPTYYEEKGPRKCFGIICLFAPQVFKDSTNLSCLIFPMKMKHWFLLFVICIICSDADCLDLSGLTLPQCSKSGNGSDSSLLLIIKINWSTYFALCSWLVLIALWFSTRKFLKELFLMAWNYQLQGKLRTISFPG